MATELLSIGEVAERTGVAVSALRFYDAEGFIVSVRSAGGQRRFTARCCAGSRFIRVAQTVGLTLDEIRDALGTLPEGRTPNKADWERLSPRGGRASTRRSRCSSGCAISSPRVSDAVACRCTRARSTTPTISRRHSVRELVTSSATRPRICRAKSSSAPTRRTRVSRRERSTDPSRPCRSPGRVGCRAVVLHRPSCPGYRRSSP